MQASITRTPIMGEDDTICLAIELSWTQWLVAAVVPGDGRLSRFSVPARDLRALLDLINKLRERARRALGRETAMASCYEAGRDGFWLHRWLLSVGVANLVFDPASIAVDRRARRAKTDALDVEMLLRTLLAQRRGEPQVVRVVRAPSEALEDARRLERGRERLVKERTAHINRIKGLLATLGLEGGRPWRKDWPAWLGEQRDWQGQAVAAGLARELLAEHERLLLVVRQVAEIDALRVAPEHMLAPAIRELSRLKGIGPGFASLLGGEVFWKDFKNRREVAGYFGLAPSPWQSGSIARDQGISKAGNRRARHAAVELAWLWLRHQPESALARWYKARVGETKGRVRRIAIVALARKLMVALWRFLATGLVPADATLKA